MESVFPNDSPLGRVDSEAGRGGLRELAVGYQLARFHKSKALDGTKGRSPNRLLG